jgi:hypothetical protein
MAATEGSDISSGNIGLAISLALAATEGADSASGTIGLAISLSLSATEGADTSAAAVGLAISLSLAATEGADSCAATVTITLRIIGVTKDATGAVLGSCRVELYLTSTDAPQATQTSDGSGNFTFSNPGAGPFYIVAYKAGSPDVAGTTVNTLVPS